MVERLASTVRFGNVRIGPRATVSERALSNWSRENSDMSCSRRGGTTTTLRSLSTRSRLQRPITHVSGNHASLESNSERIFYKEGNSFDPNPSLVRSIDVGPLADSMRSRVKKYTDEVAGRHMDKVKMVGILAEAGPYRPDAEMYSRRIADTFAQDGIAYEICRCSGDSRDDVEAAIRTNNEREDIHGILVFYPIFKGRVSVVNKTYISQTGVYYKTDDDYLRDLVLPSKDVEGLRFNHRVRNMFRARTQESRTPNDVFIPCTALAVTRILDAHVLSKQFLPECLTMETSNDYNLDLFSPNLSGCTVTIKNRSEVLGRPLAGLLALKGATVFSIDEHSILCFGRGRMRRCHLSKEECLAQSSVIVTGVPTSKYCLPVHAIQEGTTIINVSEFPNVDVESLMQRGIRVNHIPSVGKVTVAALEENLIRLHRQTMEQS
ncbi:hypothetical protein ACA910_007355 [Epithemia clementina (nom. ined.)]